MESSSDLVLLRTFGSEAEARVVQAFLGSHGIPADLWGTHSQYDALTPTRLGVYSLRLMVPAHQKALAEQLLAAQEPTSEDVVLGLPPAREPLVPKPLIVLFLLLFLVYVAIQYLARQGTAH